MDQPRRTKQGPQPQGPQPLRRDDAPDGVAWPDHFEANQYSGAGEVQTFGMFGRKLTRANAGRAVRVNWFTRFMFVTVGLLLLALMLAVVIGAIVG